MIAVDVHTHTSYSHGNNTVREMFEAGQSKGLKVQGFSEHSPRPLGYDYPVEYRARLEEHFADYIQDVREIQAENPRTVVLLGLELDWLEAEMPAMREIAARYPYDYIIGGIHFLGCWGFDATPADWAGLTDAECASHYAAYYATMARMAESGLFQVAAHPDLIKIFSRERFHAWLPGHMEQVGAALNAIKTAGMALEISSAGLHKPCTEIYPCPELMRAAASMKIPVSFASDCHSVSAVARDFERLAEYARSFGYHESVYFKGKKTHVLEF